MNRKFGENGLYLPCGPSLTDNSIDKVIDLINAWNYVK